MNTHVPPQSLAASSRHWAGWPLARVLVAMAGAVTLASAALAVAGDCISSVILRRVFGLGRGGTR